MGDISVEDTNMGNSHPCAITRCRSEKPMAGASVGTIYRGG